VFPAVALIWIRCGREERAFTRAHHGKITVIIFTNNESSLETTGRFVASIRAILSRRSFSPRVGGYQ